MKTFETQKGNIPEGATHYSEETEHIMFCWFKKADNNHWLIMTSQEKTWYKSENFEWKRYSLKQIPQTKEVEWVNGDKCLYMNSSEVHKFIGIDPTRNDFCYIKADCSSVNWVEIAKLSKPESEADKLEREELEAAYYLYQMNNRIKSFSTVSFEEFKNKLPKRLEAWLAIVKETRYRKGE